MRCFLGACVFVSILILPGCGSEDGWTQQPPPFGLLRVVNTISDSSSLNVDYETQRIGFVDFAESTAFIQVLPDVTRTLLVSFVRDNQLVGLISQDIEIGIDHLTTVIIAGTMSEPLLLIIEDLPVDFPEDNTLAELRFVHAATSLPSSVDFHLTAADAPAGTPLVTLPLNAVSELIDFEENTESRLQTFITGQPDPFWDSGSFPVPASSRPLLILVDYFGPGDTEARVISVSGIGTAMFPNEVLDSSRRLANMNADITSVDIYLDEELIGEDMLFGDISGFDDIDPGTYTLVVTTANSVEDVITEDTFTAVSGEFQTIVTAGIEGERSIITTIDDFRRVTDRATLAITNSSPAAGSVDVYILLAGQSVDDVLPAITALFYPSHSRLRLVAGTYDVVFTEPGTKTITIGPERLTLESLGLYRIYMTDSAGGGAPVNIILGDDFDPPFSP